jgi:glyoxylase-like metal-dependent hydrolase (beta-lactamase superfamily II)
MEVVPGLHWVDRIWDTKVYVLVEEDRLVVIDAATPGRSRAIWHFLRALGYPPEAVDDIWISHGDIDHIGSAAALKAVSGAQVVAHRADVPLVEGRTDRELGQVAFGPILHRLFNGVIHHMYRPVTVDRTVTDGDHLGEWQIVHTPGHTAGSIAFYHPRRRIVILGDALNYKRGRLGVPPRLFTPDMAQAHASIRQVAGLDFDVCCFGHGPPLCHDARQRIRAFADSLP